MIKVKREREEGRKNLFVCIVYCVINKGKIRERGEEREKNGEKKIWAEVYLYG